MAAIELRSWSPVEGISVEEKKTYMIEKSEMMEKNEDSWCVPLKIITK